MILLLLNLLQQQRGGISKVVIIGAVLVFIAGVSLLVYFYRRYKRTEKESEDDWDASRHSLFVNSPSASRSVEASKPAPAKISVVPEVVPVETQATREFATEVESPPALPASAAPPEPRVEPPPPTSVSPVAPKVPATELLASPSPLEPVAKHETDAAAFDDEVWSGLEAGEQPPLAHEQITADALPRRTEPPPVARVDQHPHRE